MPDKASTPSIQRKILRSFVVLLVLPMTVVTAFAYWQSAKAIEEKTLRQFAAVTSMASQQFDQYFRDVENLSINILRNELVQRTLRQGYVPPNAWTLRQIEEEEAVQHFLSGIYELKPGISSIILYGTNKMTYFYHPTRTWNHTIKGESDPFFPKVVAAGGQWVLSGMRGERQLTGGLNAEPENVVTFGRMIRDLNTMRPLGVVYINVRLEMLQSLTDVKDADSRLVILDAEGESVFSSPSSVGTIATDKLLKVNTVAPFTKWTSVYMVSRDDLFKESRQLRNFILGVTAMSLLAALVLANFISSGIVKPLGMLRKTMKRVAHGELDLELTPVSADEVGELTQGFNRMVQRLKALLAEVRNQEQKRMAIELKALQARINPHFLYNTLNGIRWVAMMEGNGKVAEMISSLVYLLQFSARNTDALISVRHELVLLEHYVQLMKMRNDRFDFRITADESVRDCSIISFLLQPIVENAIFHGITPSNAQGTIEVRITREAEQLCAVVQDNGVGMSESDSQALFHRDIAKDEDQATNHIGLGNVYSRLKLHFGDRAEMRLESEPGQGTAVYMYWPAQTCRVGGGGDNQRSAG